MRPRPKAVLWLVDALKVFVISTFIAVASILAIIIFNNLKSISFLSNRNIISDSVSPLWLSIVPELSLILLGFFAGLIIFYIYNQMALSGYRAGVALIGLLCIIIFSSILLHIANNIPHLKLMLRNAETSMQKPLPSQGYFQTIMDECESNGYHFGWIQDINEDSLIINEWGETRSIPLQQISEHPNVGDKVIVSNKECLTQRDCHKELVVVN
jgi:hypothetical protein